MRCTFAWQETRIDCASFNLVLLFQSLEISIHVTIFGEGDTPSNYFERNELKWLRLKMPLQISARNFSSPWQSAWQLDVHVFVSWVTGTNFEKKCKSTGPQWTTIGKSVVCCWFLFSENKTRRGRCLDGHRADSHIKSVKLYRETNFQVGPCAASARLQNCFTSTSRLTICVRARAMLKQTALHACTSCVVHTV